MCDKDKVPWLVLDLLLFLDHSKFAKFIQPCLLPTGTLGIKVWSDPTLKAVKSRLIQACYWCDLIISRNGSWFNMIHPEEGSNPTFEKEVDRLIVDGVPENLIDMVGMTTACSIACYITCGIDLEHLQTQPR